MRDSDKVAEIRFRFNLEYINFVIEKIQKSISSQFELCHLTIIEMKPKINTYGLSTIKRGVHNIFLSLPLFTQSIFWRNVLLSG